MLCLGTAYAQTPIYEYLFNNNMTSTGSVTGTAANLTDQNSAALSTYVSGRTGVANSAIRVGNGGFLGATLASLPTGTAACSMSFWVSASSISSASSSVTLMGWGPGPGEQFPESKCFYAWMTHEATFTGNEQRFYASAESSNVNTSPLNRFAIQPSPVPNVWIHYAIVRTAGTSGTVKVFRNGVVIIDQPATGWNTIGNVFRVNTAPYTTGVGASIYDYDDIKIYNTALTDAQVQADFGGSNAAPAAPVYNYLFNNTLTTTANANALTGAGATFVTGRSGGANAAVQLSSNPITANLANLPLGSSSRTISFWAKLPSTFTNASIGLFGYGGVTANTGYSLWQNVINTNRTTTVTNSGAINNFSLLYEPRILLTSTPWIHYAVVYENNIASIYRDGQLLGTSTAFAWNTVGTNFYLGSIQDGTTYFNTTAFDDLAIYNVALSANQIKTLYNTASVNGPTPIISSVSSSAVGGTQATINYTINANGNATTSTIAYGTSAATLSTVVNGSNATGSTNTSLTTTLTGLLPNTTYFYQVRANNTNGDATPSTVASFTTSSAIPIISNVSSSNVGGTSARINYTLQANGLATTSTINYGTSPNPGDLNSSIAGATSNTNVATAFNTSISGLMPLTTYYYQVLASNSSGSAIPSTVRSFTTLGAPPSLTGVSSSNVTDNFATLNYTVNANGTNSFVNIRYGTTSGNLTTEISGSNTILGSSNTVLSKDLFSLQASTVYYYRIYAINTNGDSTVSTEMSFTTLAVPLQTVPTISNVTTGTITTSSAFVNYTVNANGATTTPVVRYGTTSTNLNLSATGTAINGSANTNGSIQLTGLSLNTQYFYRVEASNSGGNATPSNTASFTTLNVVLTAPTNGLVAYYGFNNTTNSHNGNHNLTSATTASYVTGKVGNGVSFSNATDRTLSSTTLTNALPSNGPFTICFWQNEDFVSASTDFPTYFEMFGSAYVRAQKASQAYTAINIGYAYSNSVITTPIFEGNSGFGNYNPSITTGWNHFAIVHNPGPGNVSSTQNFAMYINGVFVGEVNRGFNQFIHKFNNMFTIGGGTNGAGAIQANKRFDGIIDEFYVYNRVLTPTEIATVRDEQNG
ncbi:MAG: hypothetical protein EAZ47_11220, partial [Bacteroidetes bacterium]